MSESTGTSGENKNAEALKQIGTVCDNISSLMDIINIIPKNNIKLLEIIGSIANATSDLPTFNSDIIYDENGELKSSNAIYWTDFGSYLVDIFNMVRTIAGEPVKHKGLKNLDKLGPMGTVFNDISQYFKFQEKDSVIQEEVGTSLMSLHSNDDYYKALTNDPKKAQEQYHTEEKNIEDSKTEYDVYKAEEIKELKLLSAYLDCISAALDTAGLIYPPLADAGTLVDGLSKLAVYYSDHLDQFEVSQNEVDALKASAWTGGGEAYGLSYVPYDNFPARLHEGERVLTASEARTYGSGTPTIAITGNSFSIREEADIDKVAKAIAHQLTKAYVLAE